MRILVLILQLDLNEQPNFDVLNNPAKFGTICVCSVNSAVAAVLLVITQGLHKIRTGKNRDVEYMKQRTRPII